MSTHPAPTGPFSVSRTWTAEVTIPAEFGFRSADDVTYPAPWSDHDLQADQLDLAARALVLEMGRSGADYGFVQLFKNTKAHGNRKDMFRTVELTTTRKGYRIR